MRVSVMIGASVLALGFCGVAVAETVRVGVVLPYSGVNADLGDVQKRQALPKLRVQRTHHRAR